MISFLLTANYSSYMIFNVSSEDLSLNLNFNTIKTYKKLEKQNIDFQKNITNKINEKEKTSTSTSVASSTNVSLSSHKIISSFSSVVSNSSVLTACNENEQKTPNQEIALAVDINQIEYQNLYIRLLGKWWIARNHMQSLSLTSDLTESSLFSFPSYSDFEKLKVDEACIAFIDVRKKENKVDMDFNYENIDRRKLANTKTINNSKNNEDSMHYHMHVNSNYNSSNFVFPTSCEEVFALEDNESQKGKMVNLKNVSGAVICGIEKEFSRFDKYLTFRIPNNILISMLDYFHPEYNISSTILPTLEFVKNNFASAKSSSNDITNDKSWKKFYKIASNFSDNDIEYTAIKDLNTKERKNTNKNSHIFSNLSLTIKNKILTEGEVGICFRENKNTAPKKIANLTIFQIPSVYKKTGKLERIEVRKFINPGWNYTFVLSGLGFLKYNRLSIKHFNHSLNACAGFWDENTYKEAELKKIIKDEINHLDLIYFFFEENYRNYVVMTNERAHSLWFEYNLCFYNDENTVNGTKIVDVQFVMDAKDAGLLVSFIMFVVIVLPFFCGLTISCYAYKHRRLRRKFRRLRLVQQRDDIERRLMDELRIYDNKNDSDDENNN